MLWFVAFFFTISFLTPPALAHSQTQVIEMTPSGFQPETAKIDASSSVIFVNKDKESRWPASNVHPTHELYPEFDPRRPINPGESWSIKMKKVGTWKYHDHLFPHMRAAITVIAEEGENEQTGILEKIKLALGGVLQKITGLFSSPLKPKNVLGSNNFTKLPPTEQIEALADLAKSNGSQSSWQFIKDTFKNQAGSSGNIHDLAHLSGSLIYDQKGFAGIGLCSSEFAFGCFHGFLDKAFQNNLDHLLEAEESCLKLGGESSSVSGPVASCIHGIGHGVASFHSSTDLKKSLSTCRKLNVGKEYCFDGVFMEFVRSAPQSFFKKGDPLYPCNQLEQEYGYAYSFACGRNQPSLLMSRFSLGFEDVSKICLKSSSKPFKQACFDSLGFSIASSGDVGGITQACQSILDPEFVARCIQAAAGELVFQEVPNWQEKAPAVCNSIAENKDKCLEHVDQLIKEYGKQGKKNFRSLNPNEDINSYIRGQIKICYDIAGKDGCYREVADLLYNQLGLSKTLGLLKINEGYPEVYARCHEVTHYLSRAEYQKQKSIAKVYAQCDSTCHGGCYHGTLEAYLKDKNLEGSKLGDEFSKVCGKESDYQKPLVFNECLHGLGHAAMFVTEMELKESLKLCDKLEDQAHKERCFSGVFMENSSSSTSFDHASLYIKKEDPFYPCNILEEKYQATCWQYQSSYFSILNNQDWNKVANMCLQIPEKYQDKCFRTIGTNQVGFTASLDLMKKDCEMMPSDHYKNICVEGVIASFAYRFVGDVKKMADFCSIVNNSQKQSCYMQLGTALLDWDSNKDLAKQTCGKLSDQQGSSWCSSAL